MRYQIENRLGTVFHRDTDERAALSRAKPANVAWGPSMRLIAYSEDGTRSVVTHEWSNLGWKEVTGARKEAASLLETEAPPIQDPSYVPSPDPTALEPIQLGKDQQAAYDDILAGKNTFVTGPAGNGKTFLIREAIDALRRSGKVVAVAATTGIAAISNGGQTIHSLLGTGYADSIDAWQSKMSSESQARCLDRLSGVNALFIDEISMAHGEYMELVNWWLNRVFYQGNDGIFGGLQIITAGDFLQLPAVIKDRRVKYPYAFEAPIWKRASFAEHYLRKGFRQGDAEFRKHLLRIRLGRTPEDTLDYFNERHGAVLDDCLDPTIIFPTNSEAETLNARRLSELTAPSSYYEATFEGSPGAIEALKKAMPCYEVLELKEGAYVLMTRNNPGEGYMNGTRGVVKEMLKDGVMVETKDGVVKVCDAKWETNNPKGKPIASVKQLPILLGWACTAHRSQGLTLDSAAYDPARTFERAQTYVALSRVRTIQGLTLKGRLRSEHVRASKKAVDYYKGLLERRSTGKS